MAQTSDLRTVKVELPGAGSVEATLPRPVADEPRHRFTQGGETTGDARPGGARAAGIGEIDSPEALGRLIRDARERRNLSQQNFADLAGVGRRFVSELENGKSTLELGKVLRAAHAAGLSISVRER